ncbi:MAG: hypothetical protein ACOCWO_03390 [Candidatus Muiribacteriaceae bacterium]
MGKIKNILSHHLILVIALIFITTIPARLIRPYIYDKLNDGSVRYIENIKDSSFRMFLVLSGLKTALSIVEGSSIGFNFIGSVEVEAGDVVQSVLDLTDIAWKSSLAILIFSSIYINLSDILSNHFTFLFTALFSSAFLALYIRGITVRKKLKNVMTVLTRHFFIICLMMYFILPGIILLSEFIENGIISDLHTENNNILENLSSSVERVIDSLKEDMKKIDRNTLTKIRGDLADELSVLSDIIITDISYYFLQMIVFPLVLFLLLFNVTRKIFTIGGRT